MVNAPVQRCTSQCVFRDFPVQAQAKCQCTARGPGGTPVSNRFYGEVWRPRPESNRGIRICSPLRHHSATWPFQSGSPVVNGLRRCEHSAEARRVLSLAARDVPRARSAENKRRCRITKGGSAYHSPPLFDKTGSSTHPALRCRLNICCPASCPHGLAGARRQAPPRVIALPAFPLKARSRVRQFTVWYEEQCLAIFAADCSGRGVRHPRTFALFHRHSNPSALGKNPRGSHGERRSAAQEHGRIPGASR